jgi:hypothetical protein
VFGVSEVMVSEARLGRFHDAKLLERARDDRAGSAEHVEQRMDDDVGDKNLAGEFEETDNHSFVFIGLTVRW